MNKLEKNHLMIVILTIIISLAICKPNLSFASWADLDDATADKITNAEEKQQEKKIEETATKSNNNYLKKLNVEGYELEPGFDKQTLTYEIKEQINANQINISADVENEKATIKGSGKVELQNGENVLRIDVTAENGDIRTYTIKINAKATITTNANEETKNNVNTIIANNTNVDENESSNKTSMKNYMLYIGIGLIIAVIIIAITKKNNRKRKH